VSVVSVSASGWWQIETPQLPLTTLLELEAHVAGASSSGGILYE
jgi:hypothetical protein